VIYEQIDRIARLTYFGTLIEHELKKVGIPLWAADERITLPSLVPGWHTDAIDPTSVLTRRVKQGVAEWYALDMIKRARDGFEIHTEQGYQVGKPAYGYRSVTIRLGGGGGSTLPAPTAAQPGENRPAHVW
jgi:site-specific DNA recombinase